MGLICTKEIASVPTGYVPLEQCTILYKIKKFYSKFPEDDQNWHIPGKRWSLNQLEHYKQQI